MLELIGFIAVAGALVGLGFLPFLLADFIGAWTSRRSKAISDFTHVGSVLDNSAKIQGMITDQF